MKYIVFLTGLFCVSINAAKAMGEPPPTVVTVNLNQYLGQWYEVRRIPNSFQDNKPIAGYGICTNSTAEYALRDDNLIDVKNTCERVNNSGDRKTEVAEAIARTVRNSNNSKLKVNFTGIALLRLLGIGDGDYWILDLGPVVKDQYSWTLIGHPLRKYGWILVRDPDTSPETIEHILTKAAALGYEKSQFIPSRRP